jgi:hypothetical protein
MVTLVDFRVSFHALLQERKDFTKSLRGAKRRSNLTLKWIERLLPPPEAGSQLQLSYLTRDKETAIFNADRYGSI